MKGFFYGLVVKLSLIAVGFGAILAANGMRKDIEGVFGVAISSRIEVIEKRISRLFSDSADQEIAIATPLSDPALDKPEVVAAAAAPVVPPTVPDACAQTNGGSDRVVIGDSIRLRFFETVDPGAAGATGAGKIAYERLDLSGIYSVGQDGAISIPLIGRVDVLERAVGCLEPIVARAAFDFGSTDMRVSAAFATRPAVIAQGDLRAPGRYDYVPGMTVEQLLTIAGAPADGVTRVAATNEPYLSARKSELERALMGNLVKWHRVSAAMDGEQTLGLNDAQMVAAENVLGSQRMQAEFTALEADTRLRRAMLDGLEMEHKKIRRLIEEKQKHVNLVEWQVRKVVDQHARLIDLQERGIVKMATLGDVEAQRMAMERMLLETQTQLIELQSREIELASQIEIQKLRDQQALAMELRNISEEADGLKGQLIAVNSQLGVGGSVDGTETYVAVIIDRVSARQAKRFEASPDTLILPGDVVTTKIRTREAKQELARTILDTDALSLGLRNE